jgi:phenylalanyl-tRNA synthetase alpha chain
MVEITPSMARVLQTLAELGGKSTPEDIAKHLGLADSAVARAILSLSNTGLVQERTDRRTELKLTDEGKAFAESGLPERRIVSIVKQNGGRLRMRDALAQAGLDEGYGSIVAGWINRKQLGRIEKSGGDLQVVVETDPGPDLDEEVIGRLRSGGLDLEELPRELQEAASRLIKRNLVESKVRTPRQIEITEAGSSLATEPPRDVEISKLTGQMIASGEWERLRLRSYNVSSPVPRSFPGKYHPYLRFLRGVKRKLVALGFTEVVGPLVETAFINCDCLYMPQDHPAREIHDLYYVEDPRSASLEQFGDLVERVAATHENGWKTGSKGWGYKFSMSEASRLVLRSHGTALSVRSMISKNLQIPGKYFAIARCFRPDMLDKTHLTEFNQAEGIVLDKSLNLRNLLGILEMFAREVAGADKVRFKPDYFPFTEPSVELQAYKEGFGWMEFGGSGIFRPEVTQPLGVQVPVLAWGLGIDRLYMMSREIRDIRQLFSPDL